MRRRIVGLWAFSTVVVVALFVLTAHGAETQLDVGGDVYYLRTNTTGGICKTTVRRAVVEVRCQDGPIIVTATSEVGCTDLEGPGYCAKNEAGEDEVSGSQLNCPDGASYNLHSGRRTDNYCMEYGGLKRCESLDGGSYAEASCKSGCGNSGKRGFCCKAGTVGCRFTKDFGH